MNKYITHSVLYNRSVCSFFLFINHIISYLKSIYFNEIFIFFLQENYICTFHINTNQSYTRDVCTCVHVLYKCNKNIHSINLFIKFYSAAAKVWELRLSLSLGTHLD